MQVVESQKLRKTPLFGLGSISILGTEEILRPAGYAIPGEVALATTIEGNGLKVTGHGEGLRAIAEKKAYSEALERLALHSFCASTAIRETSNGWAAHTEAELAIESATLELIERDVALSTWENAGPFNLVPTELWPESIRAWREGASRRAEYSELLVLLSCSENGAAISALLMNGRGNFVSGHASGLDLGKAIHSAVNECLRTAHAALRFDSLSEVMALHNGANQKFQPGAHALAYAYRETLPSNVVIRSSSESEIKILWQRHQAGFLRLDRASLDITLFEAGAHHTVARVKSPQFRQIYWGCCPDSSKPNTRPHFVG